MTDRAVQPEAPTLDALREVRERMTAAAAGARFGYHEAMQCVEVVEASARAASQERPHPEWNGRCAICDTGEKAHGVMDHPFTHPEDAGVAQERPPACGHCGYAGTDETGYPIFEGVAQERPQPRTKSDRDVALSMIEQNRHLRSVLERYGQHDDDCTEWPDQNQLCDCGFADARDAALADRPPIDVLREVEDVIMSEPWWPRAGAIRRRAVMEKIRARLSRSVASPEPSE
jgi:hypothetical protein